MARVSTYLNFPRNTEQAFEFYRTVFGTDYSRGIMRFGDMPPNPECAPIADDDRQLIMHVELPTLGDHVLMGSDAPPSMGFDCKGGNNVYINLEPDTRAETDRLFAALKSNGGQVEHPLTPMFWGGYFGCLRDRFGVQWMFNCMEGAS